MTTLLLVHIISFSISLILLPILVIASITKFALPKTLRYVSLMATVSGLASGSALLIASPSGTYCALLFGYVVVFTAIYIKASIDMPARSAARVTIDR